MAEDVNAVMATIPAPWRRRWCGGEDGDCACMGCVQIGNRLIMVGLRADQIDPERIDEDKIPADIFNKYKVTKDEWLEWVRAGYE
jgi:hypothetical protein